MVRDIFTHIRHITGKTSWFLKNWDYEGVLDNAGQETVSYCLGCSGLTALCRQRDKWANNKVVDCLTLTFFSMCVCLPWLILKRDALWILRNRLVSWVYAVVTASIYLEWAVLLCLLKTVLCASEHGLLGWHCLFIEK